MEAGYSNFEALIWRTPLLRHCWLTGPARARICGTNTKSQDFSRNVASSFWGSNSLLRAVGARLLAMTEDPCCGDHLGEVQDEHDFLGHDHVTFEGVAHLASFLQSGESSPVSTLMGLFIPEDPQHSMSIVGVDVTAITPRNCCLGEDTKVYLLKITEVRVRALFFPSLSPTLFNI